MLNDLPAETVRPTYDRSALQPAIVHIGLGNFHRAHQAWYLHRLMQTGRALDWAIIGAGVQAADTSMRKKLLAQDCLTTLIELDPNGDRRTEVTGVMIDFLPVEPDNNALISAMSNPETRIVSLTVTEGGYYRNSVGGGLDTGHPDIIFDIAHPDRPRTVFGAIVAALGRRRALGNGPFTGLSCDNLQGNGAILQRTLVELAHCTNVDLAGWIGDNCSFPNSMVDCIVPATGAAELTLAQSLGISDQAPVTHEPFRQWVIEDNFCRGRPDWDLAGAEFSDNVGGFEAQKIRILNAGHQILANVAEVLNIDTVAQAMKHPGIHAMFRKIETEEIVPHIIPVSGITPQKYLDQVDRRFSNSAIADTIRRVAFDGSSRHVGFILPTIRDAIAAGGPIDGLALAEAAWARMCEGTREDGSQIETNDPVWDDLHACAKKARKKPSIWLEMRNIYGRIGDDPGFSNTFNRWLTIIYRDGIEAAIQEFVRSK